MNLPPEALRPVKSPKNTKRNRLKDSLKNRPTIAFFVSQLEGDYSETLCKGMIDAAEEHDANLMILPGKPIKSSYTRQSYFNVIYEYVTGNNVDALIISSSTICNFIPRSEFIKFCLRYKPLPVISIGIPIEGIPSVTVNNRPGLIQLLNHLIRVHGKRRIVFVKGPDNHDDAEERYSAYLDALKENGLDFDPDLVVSGDFTFFSAEHAIRILLDERKVTFDTIAAANDEMAFGILEALQKRNIRVPEDICVTGFDNGRGAKYSNPNLSTVKQPTYEQSKKAFETALALINNQKPGNIVLETEMILRESCGCFSEALQLSTPGDPSLRDWNKESMSPEQWMNLFVVENLSAPTVTAAKTAFIKNFIGDCFRELTRDSLDEQIINRLLLDFKSLIYFANLDVDDIFTIQKTLFTLQLWINRLTSHRNNYFIEKFFQMLRFVLTNVVIKIQAAKWDIHHTGIGNLRTILADMVLMIHNQHQQLKAMIPGLQSIGIDSCYLYLYDKEINYRKNRLWHNPPTVNLAMAYNQESWILEKSVKIPWENVLDHQFMPQQKRYTMLFNPLFLSDEQLGLFLCEFNPRNYYLFESLVVEIGCILRLSSMLTERKKISRQLKNALNKLEESNQKLNNISQTDELTGLYNRRGFFNMSAQSLYLAGRTGKTGLLIFADMDGLKNINDSYGHDEGDSAIKVMAGILSQTFAAANIIARIGGDEFAILIIDVDIQRLPFFQECIASNTGAYNQQSGKPYQISISVGAVSFKCETDITIENLLIQADKLLYEQKRLKKKAQ
jgi:diguanylate cyclase (GGDEF)-like protein